MNIYFRRATLADIPLLSNFENKLIAHERTTEPTLIQEGALQYYDIPKLIKDTVNATVLIAEIDGKSVGCGLGQIKENGSCYNEKYYGYIGFMYVDEEQRGKNIGGSIIQELITWFRSKEINDVHLKVYASNAGAIRAYQKYGFEHYIHEMKLRPD